jgi:hypothetical protein
MRTDPARPRPVLDRLRLRAPIETLRRRLAALGPRGRGLAAAAMLAGLVALGYHFAAAEPVGYEWLNPDHAYEPAEAGKVLAALRDAGIPCQDRSGRVSVPADRKAEALAALDKARLGPRPLDEIRQAYTDGGSFFDDPERVRARHLRGDEEYIQRSIREMPGIQAANVKLTPVDGGTRLRPSTRLRALVYVRAVDGQLLPGHKVDLILAILHAQGIAREDATLLDLWSGHEYWVGGRPEVATRSSAKAREEQLRDAIAKAVHIEGAEVFVRIDPAEASASAAASALPALPTPTTAATEAATPAPSDPPAGAALAANQPIGPAEPPPPRPSPATPPSGTRVAVWVRVPRSYYHRLARELQPDEAPTVEVLQRLAARAGEQVRQVVSALLDPGELADVRVDRFEDLAVAPPAPSGEPDLRRTLLAWLPSALGAGFALAALGLIAARRPSARVARTPRRDVFEAGDHGGPGHRARTIIRRDPAAAAGVLHRWIAQGGRTP